MTKQGVAFEALDNGILSCEDPALMRRLADGLKNAQVDALFAALLSFRVLPDGFRNRDLRGTLAPLIGLSIEAYGQGHLPRPTRCREPETSQTGLAPIAARRRGSAHAEGAQATGA